MDLKFDEMTVDTTLAKEYLKKNNLTELYENYFCRRPDDLVYVFDGKELYRKLPGELRDVNRLPVIPGKLHDLASSLKQNASLISQLEYYTRNISIEDTNAQLNLIIKYIECDATKEGVRDITLQNEVFYPNDPLLYFGCVLDRLMYSKIRVILTNVSNKTVALCHLFFKLCHEAGFKNLIVEFTNDAPNDVTRPSTEDPPTTEGEVPLGLDSGTVAIISEDADVDSAVDTLLSASNQAPWRLRRILVQEGVYQQFKYTLSWKCNLKNHVSEPLPSNLLCAEDLTYNGRIFLLDPVALSKYQQSVVTVEAYRTTKEMISFVQKDKTRYLSLWANDIAEINEVTYSTKTPVIWVNNLADFRGPPQIAEAVYSYAVDVNRLIDKNVKISKLCEVSRSWAKLDIETRRDILNSALDKCILSDSKNQQVYTEIKNSLSKYTLKSFVDVGKDYVCVGMTKPVGVLPVRGKVFEKEESFFTVDKFKTILYGNAFYVLGSYITVDGIKTIVEMIEQTELIILEEAGVPVSFIRHLTESVSTGSMLIPDRVGDTRTRVIWTNSGTIFAN